MYIISAPRLKDSTTYKDSTSDVLLHSSLCIISQTHIRTHVRTHVHTHVHTHTYTHTRTYTTSYQHAHTLAPICADCGMGKVGMKKFAPILRTCRNLQTLCLRCKVFSSVCIDWCPQKNDFCIYLSLASICSHLHMF